MTDPYAETDDWIVPATRPHGDAQPVSAPEPSGSTPEAGERVARYAEAIHPAAFACNCGRPNSRDRAVARAVMAVADQETAELRAEVEQRDRALTAIDRLLGGARDRAEAAEAESARLASEQRELAAQVAALRSVVAKVEALADSWPAYRTDDRSDYGRAVAQCRNALRAALASVGVSGSAAILRTLAPDTATPGERRMTYVDAKTHEPCPTSGPVLCTIGYTDPAHRHVAAHMVAASSADDKAGE